MIRPATAADHAAIAALQLASWRDVYAGLLPDAYLGAPVARDVSGKWSAFTPGPRDVLLVAETGAGGDLAGFVHVIGGDRPYVDNLHVHPDRRGAGIGARLMAATARALIAQGDRMVWLTVMVGNDAALRFYRRLGGTCLAERQTVLYGNPVREIPIEWHDLPALAARG